MLKIALLGHALRNDNLGVAALTVSQVRILRDIAQRNGIALRYLLLDAQGSRPACVEGSDVIERPVRPLRRPWQLVQALRDCDLVIDISGGDSFADIYGRKRLAIIFLQKFLAHLLRRPVVMAPQTIGPFDRRVSRLLARATMRRAALIATRDRESARLVRQLGVRRGVIEASDVALRLPFDPPDRRSGGPVRVGLNVSGLLMQGGYTRNNMFGLKSDYPALIRSILTHFLTLDDACEVHLVSHVISWTGSGGEDDRAAACKLAGEFPEAVVAPAFATPSEAKTYIAGLDFFMGARMHACIAAFSAGVPVVPMAYSRKFAGLFGSIGYDHTVDCKTDDQPTILRRIAEAYERRAQLGEEVATARARGIEKLARYEDALEALLLSVSGHNGEAEGGQGRDIGRR